MQLLSIRFFFFFSHRYHIVFASTSTRIFIYCWYLVFLKLKKLKTITRQVNHYIPAVLPVLLYVYSSYSTKIDSYLTTAISELLKSQATQAITFDYVVTFAVTTHINHGTSMYTHYVYNRITSTQLSCLHPILLTHVHHHVYIPSHIHPITSVCLHSRHALPSSPLTVHTPIITSL